MLFKNNHLGSVYPQKQEIRQEKQEICMVEQGFSEKLKWKKAVYSTWKKRLGKIKGLLSEYAGMKQGKPKLGAPRSDRKVASII